MMNRKNLKKAIAAIKKHKHFIVTTHASPEGDALGAELAFCRLLNKIEKSAFIVNQDPTPQEYSFLPGREYIKPYKNINQPDFDCMVVLDCSDLGRTGEVYKLNSKNKPVINIDHHISNNRFGKIRWVEPYVSSTSEMVYMLYKEMRVPFDKESALLLYVGIMTDTGSFRYSNTSGFTHKAVGELMRFNIDPRMIYKGIYENIPFLDMQLLIKILDGINRSKDGKAAWVEVPAKLLRHRKVSFDLSEHILNFMRTIKDTQVVVLFRENLGVKDEIRFNLRSSGSVDVNKIAKFFGGGGHKAAAGCTVRGKLKDIRRKVISKILKSLR
jgi:phosphoesterase RecJ-like protein